MRSKNLFVVLAIVAAIPLSAICASADSNWTPNEDWTNFPGETGDAVYRNLGGAAGHAGIALWFDENVNSLLVFQASGFGFTSGIVDWNFFLSGQDFWDVRTHPNGVSYDERQALIQNAGDYLYGLPYVLVDPWLPFTYLAPYQMHGNLSNVQALRCDGMVELAYESIGKDPCYFPPVDPHNQCTTLAAAVWENPVISNVVVTRNSLSLTATDVHSGVAYAEAHFERKKEPFGDWEQFVGKPDRQGLRWDRMSASCGKDCWKLLPPVFEKGYSYQVYFQVFDYVHHCTKSDHIYAIPGGQNDIDPFVQTVEEGSELSFTVPVPDSSGEYFYNFDADALPAGATLDPSSGAFTWTPGYDQAGTYTVIITVTAGVTPPLSAEAIVTITVTDKSPFFGEPFGDGTGAEWQVRSGAWKVNAAQKYLSFSTTHCNLSTIKAFDASNNPFVGGRIETDVTLTSGDTPDGSIVFAYTDPQHYRFAGVRQGYVVIGQVGDIGTTSAGSWKRKLGIALLKKYHLKVLVDSDGWVDLYLGARKVLSRQFGEKPAPGGVGLRANKARTIFDNVVVNDK